MVRWTIRRKVNASYPFLSLIYCPSLFLPFSFPLLLSHLCFMLLLDGFNEKLQIHTPQKRHKIAKPNRNKQMRKRDFSHKKRDQHMGNTLKLMQKTQENMKWPRGVLSAEIIKFWEHPQLQEMGPGVRWRAHTLCGRSSTPKYHFYLVFGSSLGVKSNNGILR